MLKLRTTAALLILATTLFTSTAFAAPAGQCYTTQNRTLAAASNCKASTVCATGNAGRYTFYNYYTCKAQYTSCAKNSAGNCTVNAGKPAATVAPAATTTPAATTAPTTTAPSNASALENAMLALINAERAKNGLSALTMDATLVSLARQKSQDMVTNNYFAHNSPTYGSASDMVKKAGMKVSAVGENIAHHGSMEKAHVALMASAGHRANILGKSYNAMGIGIVNDKNGYPMITQIFVRK